MGNGPHRCDNFEPGDPRQTKWGSFLGLPGPCPFLPPGAPPPRCPWCCVWARQAPPRGRPARRAVRCRGSRACSGARC